MSGDGEEPNIAIARDVQLKFDFYMLALVFTILGLSMQTATTTRTYGQCYLEFSAWIALSISALSGLMRIEWMPVLYKHHGYKNTEEKYLGILKKGLRGIDPVVNEEGDAWSAQKLIDAVDKSENHINKRDKIIERIEKRHNRKALFHKWGFYIGLACLLISRMLYCWIISK